MSEPDAVRALLACCGVETWARGVVADRPFASVAAVLARADDVWERGGPTQWTQAFAHHPRIGERGGTWSVGEQAAAMAADAAVRAELVAAQREYEQRFGHIYLVCASGKSAGDILADVRRRLGNDGDTELAIAANEQLKITRLRLRKLLDQSGEAP